MDPRPRLSCEQCQRRKRKCDKNVPCLACLQSSLHCHVVQRDRLPRGRSGKVRKQDSRLEARVARIESLLEQAPVGLQSRLDIDSRHGKANDALSSNEKRHPDEFVSSRIAPDFWQALSSEVAGIRDIIEDESDDVDILTPDTVTTGDSHDTPCPSRSLLFDRPAPQDVSPLPQPSLEMRATLLELYQTRVDSVLKAIHIPTVLAEIKGKSESPSLNSLSMAIYYMALCSTTEDECQAMFGGDRAHLISLYRAAAEDCLSKARLLQSPDLTGLTAFVIYLQAIRVSKAYASSWTLVATAVRVATALGLGSEDPSEISPFDVQLRRRLWYCICLMDTQASLDRGTAPLVTAKALGPPPLFVNDSDIARNMTLPPPSSQFNDMSFFAMTCEAMVCHKRVFDIPSDTGHNWEQWVRKQELLSSLELSFQRKYLDISQSATPLHFMTCKGAETILSSMQLLLRRPPYRLERNTVPPWDDFNVLEASTKVLENHLRISFEPYSRWKWKEWTPWYALAVALAELCRSPTGPAADYTYAIAEEFHQRHARPLTDIESGMLWKPIGKLMRRVRDLRSIRLLRTQAKSVPSFQASREEESFPLDGMSANLAQPWLDTVTELGTSGPTDTAISQTGDLLDETQVDLDLNPENGVSWLDWDLLMQDMDVTLDLF